MISRELLTIFQIASIRKFMEAAGVGVQVRYMQEGDNGEEKTQDEVQVSTAIDFVQRGSASELYSIVNITALVKTKIVPTDVYYHTRIKARVADVLSRVIPLYRIGGGPTPDTSVYTRERFGILRPVPSETMTLRPAGLDVPDASVIEAFYEMQEC